MKSGILLLSQEEPIWWVGYKSKYGPEWLSSGAPNSCVYRDQAGTLNRAGRNCGKWECLGPVVRRCLNQLQPIAIQWEYGPNIANCRCFSKKDGCPDFCT